jgi:hypothetical protein
MGKLIYDRFNSDSGKSFIHGALCEFDLVISKLEDIYDRRPFNQQTTQSLTELFLLVKILNPSTVFEVGCGTRSSTIALSLPLNAPVYSIDISPVDFDALMKTNFPGLSYSPVRSIATNAVDFKIPKEWKGPIFTLYDAHDDDLPGVKIFEYALKEWFSRLRGSVVAFHDCSVSDHLIEYPASSTHHSARHFSGRYINGYGEVIPMVEWMNKNEIDFYRPGDDLKALGFGGHDSSLICVGIP